MKYAARRQLRLQRGPHAERRTGQRFPLALELRYTLMGRYGPEGTGSGITIDLSSSGLSFAADTPLSPGQRLDVSIDWPAMLDQDVRLQLMMSGEIVRTDGSITALRIERHEFKTRRMRPELTPRP